MPKIILLGASGYIGQAFARELRHRGAEFIPLSRATLDYAQFDSLLAFLRQVRPEFLINAAGYTGKPNVDACESARAETLQGNTLLAATIAHACSAANVPWGHVSSGCIYTGAYLVTDGSARLEPDLMRPQVRNLWEANPGMLRGFAETDAPNFSFEHPPCSFYSGTKALAEKTIGGVGESYIWRLRIPFDEYDSPRNYLGKMLRYERLYDNVNSLSHRRDFVRACLDLWGKRAPFGTYNVTNPGWVTTRRVIELMRARLQMQKQFEFFADDDDFYRHAAKAPRSNCIMDVTKLLQAGIVMCPVEEALVESLKQWKPA